MSLETRIEALEKRVALLEAERLDLLRVMLEVLEEGGWAAADPSGFQQARWRLECVIEERQAGEEGKASPPA